MDVGDRMQLSSFQSNPEDKSRKRAQKTQRMGVTSEPFGIIESKRGDPERG